MRVDIDQLGQARIVLVVRSGDELDDVLGMVEAVEEQGLVGVDGLGQAQVVEIALGHVDVVQRAGQLHGLQLDDLDVTRIAGDVGQGGVVADAGLERDEAGLFQQRQATAAVDGVVGDGHPRALGHLGQGPVLLRIEPDVVVDPRYHGHQAVAGGALGVLWHDAGIRRACRGPRRRWGRRSP